MAARMVATFTSCEIFSRMTIDQLIALSASIGACLSALATFLTVQQVAKQRRASYQPDLALTQIVVTGVPDSNNKSPLPIVWNTNPPGIGSSQPRRCAIPVLNVGLGAAKDVVVSWSFPIDELVKSVNDLAQRTLTPAYLRNEHGTLYIKSDLFGDIDIMWQNQQVSRIDYVLPATVQDKPLYLEMPWAYVTLVSMLLYFRLRDPQRAVTYRAYRSNSNTLISVAEITRILTRYILYRVLFGRISLSRYWNPRSLVNMTYSELPQGQG